MRDKVEGNDFNRAPGSPIVWARARARARCRRWALRNVRHAATSGALRQRATVLGVELPPSYVDNPADARVDGHDMAAAAA